MAVVLDPEREPFRVTCRRDAVSLRQLVEMQKQAAAESPDVQKQAEGLLASILNVDLEWELCENDGVTPVPCNEEELWKMGPYAIVLIARAISEATSPKAT